MEINKVGGVGGSAFQSPEISQSTKIHLSAFTSPQVQLVFRIDESIKKVIVSVVNTNTGEVIREIPSPQAVELTKQITEVLQNMFNH